MKIYNFLSKIQVFFNRFCQKEVRFEPIAICDQFPFLEDVGFVADFDKDDCIVILSGRCLPLRSCGLDLGLDFLFAHPGVIYAE